MTTKRFTGQYHESTLPGGEGLSYYNARWYDAKLGRFVSADTIVPSAGNPQTLNRYAYVVNNPLKYVDPTGHRLDVGDSGGGGGGGGLPNGRYLCTEKYGCFDNSHWGAGDPADVLRQLKRTVMDGGGSVKVPIHTVFGTFTAYYTVAGTIPSDQIVNVGLAIYSDASIKFEEWELLGGLGIQTTFAIEDLPTHYLSYVGAATGMSKEGIFSHLGKVTGTDDDPPRTLWLWGDNTSKNRQMSPRVRINDMWLNVSWPDALTITPVSSNSGYWSYSSDAAIYTPLDTLDYLWGRGVGIYEQLRDKYTRW